MKGQYRMWESEGQYSESQLLAVLLNDNMQELHGKNEKLIQMNYLHILPLECTASQAIQNLN